jgi:uncharacterized membrane protein
MTDLTREHSAAGLPQSSPLVEAAQTLESATVLDRLSALLRPAARALLADRARADALRGMWLGHALHPLMTMLPLGAWTSASVLDLAAGPQARPAARRLVGFGLLTAVPTAVTGLAEFGGASARDQRTAAVHALANNVALGCFAASWLARGRARQARGVTWALAGLGASGVGGFLGGHLAHVRNVGSRNPRFGDDPPGQPET